MPATSITRPGAAKPGLWMTSPAPLIPQVKLTTTAMWQPRPQEQHACKPAGYCCSTLTCASWWQLQLGGRERVECSITRSSSAASAPAVPHHTPEAVESPRSLMANRVHAMDATKKAPARMPQGVKTCSGHDAEYPSVCHRVTHMANEAANGQRDEQILWLVSVTRRTHLSSGQRWKRGDNQPDTHPHIKDWRRSLRRQQ